MSDDMVGGHRQRDGRGYAIGRVPSSATYEGRLPEAAAKPGPHTNWHHILRNMTQERVCAARAGVIRNGIERVAQQRGLLQRKAILRIARIMRTTPARVRAWMDSGISEDLTWARWLCAIEKLAPGTGLAPSRRRDRKET